MTQAQPSKPTGFSAHLGATEVSEYFSKVLESASSVEAEHHRLTHHKGTIYCDALVPRSGEITANVLLISISDDITAADLIASLASLSSLSITPDF